MPQIFSTRVFFCFLVSAFVCNICEIIEGAVFLHLDSSFKALRRTSQSLYIGTLIICAFVICLYVYAKITSSKTVNYWHMFIIAIPGLVGITALFFGKVSYLTNEEGSFYNYGPIVKFSYCIGVIYVVATFIMTAIFRKRIRKEGVVALLSGLGLWIILIFIQYTFHGYQVSSLAVMLMALILFLSMENPKEYYEKNITGVRNRDALELMLVEQFGRKKAFFIVSVIFTGKSTIMNFQDRRKLERLQGDVAFMGQQYVGYGSYLSNWNTLTFVLKDPHKVEALMSMVNNYKDGSGNYRLTYSVLEVPKCTDDLDEALQVLDYVSEEYIYTQSAPNLVVDRSIVDRMILRNSIEDIVRRAVKEKAFDVYYQPILNVNEGRFTSTEALVRLRRSDNDRYISPEDFIPIAEKCGLITEIDDLVFEKVCSFIARESLPALGVKTVEVNLSGNEVVDRNTYSRLISKMEKYHIPPKFINFEITETAYINNDETFKENVQKLKEMGSTFSMDDFGSGYSNLLELLKMDYKIVKMDKEFVWSCLDKDRPDNMRMMEYSINFLKDYGLHVLAEGVETIDQAKILIEKGVEYLQGYYYSRPLPEDEYIEFLKAQKGE
jgi:EAL domain-containing protein (putative c-di-GMP-specific phosphodiesterase class I)